MDNSYADERDVRQPIIPVQPTSSNSVMDWIRRNKILVLIGIIILIILLYWFCFRKGKLGDRGDLKGGNVKTTSSRGSSLY